MFKRIVMLRGPGGRPRRLRVRDRDSPATETLAPIDSARSERGAERVRFAVVI